MFDFQSTDLINMTQLIIFISPSTLQSLDLASVFRFGLKTLLALSFFSFCLSLFLSFFLRSLLDTDIDKLEEVGGPLKV
jgi:hypothetical protein